MKIIGDPSHFAFEIGDYDASNRALRHVDIWAGGARLCIDDNLAFLGQFTNALAGEIRRSYQISSFSRHLQGLSPIDMAAFVLSTRDQGSPNYDIEDDSIYPYYRFLDLGPTTDNLSAFLFRDFRKCFFVYSFWGEGLKNGTAEKFQVMELDFEEVISVLQETMKALLDS